MVTSIPLLPSAAILFDKCLSVKMEKKEKDKEKNCAMEQINTTKIES